MLSRNLLRSCGDIRSSPCKAFLSFPEEEVKPIPGDLKSSPTTIGIDKSPPGTKSEGVKSCLKTEPSCANSHKPHSIHVMPAVDASVEGDKPKEDKGPELTEISAADLEPDATEVDFNHSRIGKLENLETLRCVEVLILRENLIKKIENISMLTTLKEVEFYDNQITKIENLDSLVNLEILDISFNRLSRIENLHNLVKLKKLFLVNNKLSKIENLEKLVNLEMLELGSNKIRVIENLDSLVNLKNLFLGKNRISKLENLGRLEKLELLSIQSNRIVKLEGLEKNRELCHLYISHNGIEQIENLENNIKLETLDLAANRIKHLKNIDHLVNIEEFWFNDNQIESFEEIEVLKHFPKLATVYLANNPIEKNPMYRRKIMMVSPTVTQIDATMCRK